MQPNIQLNFLAIAAGVLANVVIGFLWYGPLFGRAWQKEMGLPADFKPKPAAMARAMTLMVIGAFLTNYVLAHSGQVWRPSVWNAGMDMPNYMYGIYSAVFTWFGFYVPVLFGAVSWENRSWKLFSINAAYYLAILLADGMILACWR